MYTNKTTNYELPIFLGTDKANWGDINIANEKIDTAMKANEAKADNAQLSAEDSVEKAAQALAVAQESLGKVNGEAISEAKQINVAIDITTGGFYLKQNPNQTLCNLYGSITKRDPSNIPANTTILTTNIKPKEKKYIYDLFDIRVDQQDGSLVVYHSDANWDTDGSIKLASEIAATGKKLLAIKTNKILNTYGW